MNESEFLEMMDIEEEGRIMTTLDGPTIGDLKDQLVEPNGIIQDLKRAQFRPFKNPEKASYLLHQAVRAIASGRYSNNPYVAEKALRDAISLLYQTCDLIQGRAEGGVKEEVESGQ